MQISNSEEAYIVTSILDNLDPEEHSGVADAIIGNLIEAGLLSADVAPQALVAWQNEPDGEKASDDIFAIYGAY